MNEYDTTDSQRQAGNQLWPWPLQVRSANAAPVRIGDAERDRAVGALGDHFAAGRLSREELDERIDQAMGARFDADLQPLFVDLPRTAQATPVMSGPQPGRAQRAVAVGFWIVPMLLVGLVVTAVVLGAPWLLWSFVWIFMFSGFWGRRRFRHGDVHPGHIERGYIQRGQSYRP